MMHELHACTAGGGTSAGQAVFFFFASSSSSGTAEARARPADVFGGFFFFC
jgi:hypothetical protein